LVKEFDIYSHVPGLDLLREVCVRSLGQAAQSCVPGEPTCDRLFLDFHVGLGTAHGRLQLVGAARSHFEEVLANYAVSSPEHREEQVRWGCCSLRTESVSPTQARGGVVLCGFAPVLRRQFDHHPRASAGWLWPLRSYSKP
jgi:hypothetical protein